MAQVIDIESAKKEVVEFLKDNDVCTWFRDWRSRTNEESIARLDRLH